LPEDDPLELGALVGAPGGSVELEVGPGRGWFAIERLQAREDVRLVGLEIKRKWASIVDERLKRRGLAARGRVFCADARRVLPRLKPESISVVYVHFPDPWWKKRHTKRVLITSAFVEQLARVLVRGGEAFVQTDVRERALAYESIFAASPAFEPLSVGDAETSPYVAQSPRERRARRDGLPIFRLRYSRC
jgi:tRNA (guanine-N7-)-methyltransferase